MDIDPLRGHYGRMSAQAEDAHADTAEPEPEPDPEQEPESPAAPTRAVPRRASGG